MNKIMLGLLIGSIFALGAYQYKGSTTASVTMAGGIIKAQSVEVIKKYKRKDCPICKGTGFYISGDGISKVNCGYCEVEKQQQTSPQKVVIHPPVIIEQNCPNGVCPINKR